jgi:hypothetical protein
MEFVLNGREVPEFSKLQGAQNYAIWSFRVRTTLQAEGLWKLVESNVPRIIPSGITGALSSQFGVATGDLGNTTDLSKETAATKEKSISDGPNPVSPPNLDSEKARALRYIVQMVKDSLVPLIMMMSDPRVVWVKLRDLYKPKSMNRHLILKSQLYALKMTSKCPLRIIL